MIAPAFLKMNNKTPEQNCHSERSEESRSYRYGAYRIVFRSSLRSRMTILLCRRKSRLFITSIPIMKLIYPAADVDFWLNEFSIICGILPA
jgi:hypothetical protein